MQIVRTPRWIAELAEFIRFPSIAAQRKHRSDCDRCARWLAGRLREAGLDRVAVIPRPGPPIVLAESRRSASRPTVLIYGHYDVQPADPLGAWHSPPFVPEVRDGFIYGRGASDDKGQLYAHVKAAEALMRGRGGLPVNLVFLFEGEEEIGSPNLQGFIEANANRLRADCAVISDNTMPGSDQPGVTYSLRGSLSFELEVRGPVRDLHSGQFGGAVLNPLAAMAAILDSLHHKDGRVAVEGFYDAVREIGTGERLFMAQYGPKEDDLLRQAGVRTGWGEPGYSFHERATIRPAITINGVAGGYSGEGAKAVIPSIASAKINIRLVPDQCADEIEVLLRRHIAAVAPPQAAVRLKTAMKSAPVVIDRESPWMKAAVEAYRSGFGAAPVFVRSGGTIPVASMLMNTLGVAPVLLGFGSPGDNLHAPNERFSLRTFGRAVRTSTAFLDAVARRARKAAA